MALRKNCFLCTILGVTLLTFFVVIAHSAEIKVIGPNCRMQHNQLVSVTALQGKNISDQDENEPYRSSLQVAADAIAKRLDGPAKSITLEQLDKVIRPWDFPIGGTPHKYKEGRVLGFENQKWKLFARCIGYRLSKDGTLSLLLTDKRHDEAVAVSPNLLSYSKKYQHSIYSSRIRTAHQKLMQYLHPQPSIDYTDCSFRITVIGFGYFGTPIAGNKCQSGASIEPILQCKIG